MEKCHQTGRRTPQRNRFNGNGAVVQPYSLVNSTVGVRRGRWEFALIGSNLADERGPTFLGTAGPNSGQGPLPRTLGLRVRMTH